MDRFEELLKELGKLFHVLLHPDKTGKCCLNVNDSLHVQMEFDPGRDRILIAALICDVPPGKFRENLLKEALKFNGAYPRVGTLGYLERENKLALYEYLYFPEINGEKMGQFLVNFIGKATEWRQNVENGSFPQSSSPTSKIDPSLFGIKP